MLDLYRSPRPVAANGTPLPPLTLDDAYAVQARVIRARVATGERVAGRKVGCTSPAVQQQFGLGQPVTGHVMAPHVHASGVELPVIPHCAVEPELVLTLARDVDP